MLKLAIIIGVALLVLVVIKLKNRKENKEYKNNLAKFKSAAEKIKVELNQVEIISNSWSEQEFSNTRAAQIEQMYGDGERTKITTEYNINVIKFSLKIKDEVVHFEERIDMDRKTLEMKLLMQKETTLYFDPANYSNYYLDLEFL